MKTCSKCKEDLPLSAFGLYPNRNPKAHCKVCHNKYARKGYHRRKRQPKTDPDYRQMRHPDPAVMEANVQKMVARYADNKARLKRANLDFMSGAVACDLVLR